MSSIQTAPPAPAPTPKTKPQPVPATPSPQRQPEPTPITRPRPEPNVEPMPGICPIRRASGETLNQLADFCLPKVVI